MIIKMFYCMTQHFDNVKGYVASAHPFYHPKVNAFCHAGTRSVKMEALHFFRTPTCYNIFGRVNPLQPARVYTHLLPKL